MNCQHISSILDARDVNALSTGEHRACEAHATACRSCGPEWIVYTRLAAMPAPLMPPELAAQCEVLAKAGRKTASRLRWRRAILLGGVLVVAAAATIWGVASRRDEVPRVLASIPAPAGHDSVPVATKNAGPAPAVAAQVSVGGFSVQLRLQYETTDALTLQKVREYYEALAAGLRAVPGLHLIDDQAAAGPTDYRVTISNPGAADVAQGAGIAREWIATTSAEILDGEAGSTAGPAGTVYFLGMIGDAWRGDPGGVDTRGPLADECTLPRTMPCTATDLAERQVMALRKTVFPRDGSLERELEARFLDTSKPDSGRDYVMSDLLSMKMPLSAAMVREALARIALPQAANESRAKYDRINLLTLLAGHRHPEIVQPLIDLARYDSDVFFRIEVVRVLAADFPTDPAVRAVLEEIAAEPSSPQLQSAAAALLRDPAGN